MPRTIHAAPSAPTRLRQRHLRTQDVDEQAALLEGWNQNYAQLSAGGFEGRIDEAWTEDVHLFVETTGQRLLQSGALPPDRVALGLPLAPVDGPAVFCGTDQWSGRVAVFSGAAGFEFLTPQGLQMAGLVVDTQALLALAVDEDREELDRRCHRPGLLACGAEAAAELSGFLRSATARAIRDGGLFAHPRVLAAWRQAVLSNVLGVFLSGELPGQSPAAVAAARRWQLVAQARERVLASPGEPVTVAQLCTDLGVSRRGLQASFQSVLGQSPAQFLRAVRLAGARRALRSGASVTEAAVLWGFWHFGHFAKDYRQMFGELPSQTLRQAGRTTALH